MRGGSSGGCQQAKTGTNEPCLSWPCSLPCHSCRQLSLEDLSSAQAYGDRQEPLACVSIFSSSPTLQGSVLCSCPFSKWGTSLPKVTQPVHPLRPGHPGLPELVKHRGWSPASGAWVQVQSPPPGAVWSWVSYCASLSLTSLEWASQWPLPWGGASVGARRCPVWSECW